MAIVPGYGRRRWTPRVPAPDEPGGGPQDAGAATPASGASMSDNELREAAFLGVRWFAVTQAIAQITTLAAAVVLARLISPADFGRLAIAIIVSEFSLMISNETIGTPLVQRPDITRKHLEGATLLGLMIGIALALLTLFAIPLVTTPVFGARTTDLFRLFAPQFAITGLMIVPQARLQRDLRFRRIGLSEATGVVVSSIISVALAIAGLGAAAYVLGMLIGVLIMALGYISGGRPVMPRWHPKEMRELLGFGLPATAAGFAGVSYRNVDYMILGARLSSVIVGFYYRAFTIGVEYERRLSGIVARIAFPVYTRTEDPERRLALRLRIVRVNVVLVYPMLALFIALAPTLVPWLFGAHWTPAILPAQILAVAGMASCVRNLHGPTVLAAGRPKALFLFCCAETLAYAATVWVASSHGLTIVCVAVSGFQLASLLIAYTVLLHSTVGMARTQIFRDLGPAVLASTPLLLVAMALRRALADQVPVPVLLILAGAAGGTVYLLALRALSKEAWSDVALLTQRVLPGVERLGRRLLPGPVRSPRPERATGPSRPSQTSALNAAARAAIKSTSEAQSRS
ncbi:MAG TPA: oligosaccharide flippase family protein [Solirubrobacteraceae bacterium]